MNLLKIALLQIAPCGSMEGNIEEPFVREDYRA